jgi:shikimate kinase
MKPPCDNIVLVGFASTGKSTTGRALAERLGWPFVDLDDIVEEIHIEERGVARRCREIFSLFGRECFIDYERRAIDSLSSATRTVIATGGGTPVDEINRDRTRRLGYVVYLNANVPIIYSRMTEKGYPQYLGPNPSLSDLTPLWRERNRVYAAIADLVIDNTSRTPEATADLIVDHLDRHAIFDTTRE